MRFASNYYCHNTYSTSGGVELSLVINEEYCDVVRNMRDNKSHVCDSCIVVLVTM